MWYNFVIELLCHWLFVGMHLLHILTLILVKDIHDLIKYAKFGGDRLRRSGVVAGQISAFPIDFAGRPYNTLTLPCERVMYKLQFLIFITIMF